MPTRRSVLTFLRDDLHSALRSLRHAPGFALAVVLTLALGIGAVTAMFSVVDAALLRPLPYPEPKRLVAVFETMPGNDRRQVAPANLVDWRNESRTLTALAAFAVSRRTIGSGAVPERVLSSSVSGNIFTTLGARAALGRTFVDSDDSGAEHRLAVLSDGLWRRTFGAAQDIVGRAVRIDDEPFTIIGVMPSNFRFPERTDLWTLGTRGVPELRGAGPEITSMRDVHYFRVIGRLRPGSNREAARREMSAIAARLAARYPDTNRDLGVSIEGLQDALTGNTRATLLFLFGVVGLVLLLASTNVAGLTLARSGKRRREFAIRTAIGASRGQLVRQVLAESTLLSLLGGVLGVALAALAIGRLVAAAPIELPEVASVGIDVRVLVFALLVSAATGVAFGLLPALQASAASALGALRPGSRGATARPRLRGALVVGELAVSLTLLFGAGLLLKSFLGLMRVDPGFTPERVVTIDPALSRSAYSDPTRVLDYYRRVLERVSVLPGVEAAGAVSVLPASGQRMNRGVRIEGRPEPARATDQTVEYQAATPGYFAAMGIPLKRGRAFEASDDGRAAPVAVINEEAARQYWPGIDPIGRRVGFGGPAAPTWRTIVGIIGDVRQLGLDQPALPEVFVPLLQDPDRDMSIVVRTSIDPASVSMALRRAVQEVDPSQPLMSPRLMTRQLAGSLARPRFFSALLGGFATAALLLATLGVYGVVATGAQARTREMGIRVALGAQRSEILGLVLSGGAKLAAAGIALGVAGAFLFARGVRGLLIGVEPVDPGVFVLTAALLSTAVLLASWLPARRAARADPMTALRAE
ncbi:MAG TPA: ABC transporter permease [Gemmatimonadaceae bacterium]